VVKGRQRSMPCLMLCSHWKNSAVFIAESVDKVGKQELRFWASLPILFAVDGATFL
jgi:hypothetical protein